MFLAFALNPHKNTVQLESSQYIVDLEPIAAIAIACYEVQAFSIYSLFTLQNSKNIFINS